MPGQGVHVELRARALVGPGLAAVGTAHDAAQLDAGKQNAGVVRAKGQPADVRGPGPRRIAPRGRRGQGSQAAELAPGDPAVAALEDHARLTARIDGPVDTAD